MKSDFKNGVLTLTVSGADLIDGSPIYDIKPYIRFTDSHEDAVSGFADTEEFPLLKVEIAPALLSRLPESKRETLLRILENDPRPAYQNEDGRTYGFPFSDFEIHFTVENGTLKVTGIDG